MREVVFLYSVLERPLEVLHPALGPQVQQRHGPAKGVPEENHEKDQRAATCFLWRKAERIVVVHPGEEKDLRTSKTFFRTFSTLRECLKNAKTFYKDL